MKRFKAVFLILLAFSFISSGCTTKVVNNKARSESKFNIVTSFYPMYIHTINIAKGIDGVQVINMTQSQKAGCLHDYQLTTADMKTLEIAKVFVINGSGMENFIEKVTKQLPNLRIAEASRGMKLIKGTQPGELDNPHVWVGISGAIEQVKQIANQLGQYDKLHAKMYKKNAEEYVEKLEKLKDKMHNAIDGLPNKKIVTFHEAFPYFAKEFNLDIVAVVEREPGSEPSAGELKDTIKKVKQTGVKALFAEPQYPVKAAETIAVETNTKVFTLNPAVTGDAKPDDFDAYIDIMNINMKTLMEALK